MKRLLIYIAVMFCALSAVAWARFQDFTAKQARLIGTWQLVSAYHNDEPEVLAGKTEVKMISDRRFMWIEYDSAKNKTLQSGFGTYVLNGNSYTEHIELLDAQIHGTPFIGRDLTFTVRIEGDTLSQTGTVGPMKLSETWKRME